MALTLSNYLAALRQSAAKPGDPAGGFLEGQRDQLQKLPGAGQGHGGEFVMNAEATRKFRPILEAMNRSVPASKSTKAERPSRGRAYYEGGGVGSEGAGPAGSSASGDDEGVSTDTSTDASSVDDSTDDPAPPPADAAALAALAASLGMNAGLGAPVGFDVFAPTNATPFGFSLDAAHGHPDSVNAALNAAVNSVLGVPGVPTAASVPGAVAGLALTGTGLGAVGTVAANAAVAAANAQTDVMSGLTGLTPGEISSEMAAANTASADAAAGTGLGPGGQGGADAPEWGWEPGQPPVALSDYLAWLRRSTTPLKTALGRSPAMTPWGTWALPVYHEGGVVKPAAGKRGLREALILAEPGEYVVQRGPSKKYRRLLDAINADDPTRITQQARTLREAMTR